MSTPTSSRAARSVLPYIAVGLLALVVGLLSSLQLSKPEQPVTQAVTVLPAPRALPEFQMVDKEGAAAGRETFEGQWSLVFMGFTNCGHICPTKMAEMRMIHDRVERPLQVVFVSVDPGRDTPEVIKAYVERFDESFTGMTGTAENIEVFAGALGAPYFVDTTPGKYVVDHSTALFLIGPDGALAGTITPPFDIPVIADDLNRLL